MTILHSERYANSLDSLPLDLSTLKLTDEQFDRLCVANPEQPLELTAQGVLVIMSPVGGESGEREADICGQLYVWNRNYKLGKVFSSSTIFKLPLGSKRSPDAAWVELSRWNTLSLEQQQKFPPIAPDFLIELRSRTDILATLQDKMIEYRDNGVLMGLLINPQDKQVEIYRIDRDIEVIQSPKSVDCNDILSGFILDLANII